MPSETCESIGSICAQFLACSHALVWTRPKTAFSAPHSTSPPHLAQTEQVRLTRFFALPDSNTSPGVTISVWGHVVVSQMGIVQVPYATVTVKYFRALMYACMHACMWYMFVGGAQPPSRLRLSEVNGWTFTIAF